MSEPLFNWPWPMRAQSLHEHRFAQASVGNARALASALSLGGAVRAGSVQEVGLCGTHSGHCLSYSRAWLFDMRHPDRKRDADRFLNGLEAKIRAGSLRVWRFGHKSLSPPNSGGLWWQGVCSAGCQAICFHARVRCILRVRRLGSSRDGCAALASVREPSQVSGGMSQCHKLEGIPETTFPGHFAAKLRGNARGEACSGARRVVAESWKAANQHGSSQNTFGLGGSCQLALHLVSFRRAKRCRIVSGLIRSICGISWMGRTTTWKGPYSVTGML